MRAAFESEHTGFATGGHNEYFVRRYRPLLEGSVSVALICSPGHAVGAKLSSCAHGDAHVVSETRTPTPEPVCAINLTAFSSRKRVSDLTDSRAQGR